MLCLTLRPLNAREESLIAHGDTLRRSRSSREIDYHSRALPRPRDVARPTRRRDTRRRNENEDARRKRESEKERERVRERKAYLLSGGRLYSGDNDVVVAPIGNAVGDRGRGGGFIARRMLHPTTTYHRRRSGLRDRLEEVLFASPLYDSG